MSTKNFITPNLLNKEAVARPDLIRLIDVSHPYFALTQVRQIGQMIMANIPVDLHDHNEQTDISMAEVGRHLAILGSLAMAEANPKKEKHFYLATEAILERTTAANSGATWFIGSAKTESINRKEGEVHAELSTPDGLLLYNVKVKYAIIPVTIFQRLYANNKLSGTPVPVNNPYKNAIKLNHLTRDLQNCSASIEKIKPEQCAGHFEDFPALPVACIGGALATLAGEHHNYLMQQNNRYCFKKAIIHANSFVFANNSIKLESTIEAGKEEDDLVIKVVAHSESCKNATTLRCSLF